jgi:hypothetical protein
MPFEQFDRSKLTLLSLQERAHDIDRSKLILPDSPREEFEDESLPIIADKILDASKAGRSIILFCGAHVIKSGCGPLLVDLIERGLVSHLALNGAGAIHDFELAMIGATSEKVARYIAEGQFGLWKETGKINSLAGYAARNGLGLGEVIGNAILGWSIFPYRRDSVLAAGAKNKIPITVHVGIGSDIIHEHPNCDGAALGAASYTDFLIFAQSVKGLNDGGVFLNIGSAVAGPEVYLKALAMCRNVGKVENFTTAVFDIVELGDTKVPIENFDPRYYFRPFKTILVRTSEDSYYVKGEHKLTIPKLYDILVGRENLML